jgi:hypothetical protein
VTSDGTTLAAVQVSANALSSTVSGLSAAYTIKVQENGTYAAMQLGSNTTTGSSVIFACDKFEITKADGTGATPIFAVGTVNGLSAVGINGQLIVDGSVTARQINGTDLHITGNGQFSGNLTAASGYFSGDITGSTGTFNGMLSAGVLGKVVNGTQYYTAGTYTIVVPVGFTSLRATLLGGGGGGGPGSDYSRTGAGSGGGAGEKVTAVFNNLTDGATYTLTVGAGGMGSLNYVDYPNTYSDVPGQSGGATSITGLLTAAGGTGGHSPFSATSGSIGGQLSIDGYIGGVGGSSAYGTGGVGINNSIQVLDHIILYGGNGTNATGYGSGGGGGGGSCRGVGGNGTEGRAIIEFFNPNGVVLRNEYSNLIDALTRQGIATT